MRLSLGHFPTSGGVKIIALLCATMVDVAAVNAGTLTVTSTADSGAGSLRDTIAAATDGDTIQFDAALQGQIISLTSAQLVIDKNITISGPGPNQLAVERTLVANKPAFRIFHVLPGHTVTIEGLRIKGGNDAEKGSGVLNDHATLIIDNCAVDQNGAMFNRGGGIYNDGSGSNGTLTILDSTISGNFGYYAGGGLYNDGSVGGNAILTITNSIVTSNGAGAHIVFISRGSGGGIHNDGVDGSATVTITNSIVSNNLCGGNLPSGKFPFGNGGGIANHGLMTITNSTISGNSAGVQGGGIDNYGALTINSSTISGNRAIGQREGEGLGHGAGLYNAGPMTITNSTLSNNNSTRFGGGVSNTGFLVIGHSTLSGNSAIEGSGIANQNNIDGDGTVEIGNTILKASTASPIIFNNAGLTITSHGYNLSSDDGSGFLTATGDQINIDPMLGPLQNNGGQTFTHGLLTGSPAIDTGDPNFTPPPLHDQRGPAYARVFKGRIDIGSLEAQPGPTPSEPCVENFDAVAAPALPHGWVATNPLPGNGILWSTSTTMPDTAPNAAFIDAQEEVSDKVLDSRPLFISSGKEQISFRHSFDTELDRDGGVLEVSSPNIHGGQFTDVTHPAVGGSFVAGGYTGQIIDTNGNPLAGRMAWTGNSGGYINTVVNLGPNLSPIIKLRFRMGTDFYRTGTGWFVDTLVAAGLCGTQPTPTPTPSATPVQALNISTRLRVETGDNVLIGGFIVTGNAPKNVAVRGIGPSLEALGISDPLADPTLELRAANGTLIVQNDNWQDNPAHAAQLTALGLAPQHPNESGIVATLNPGASYTAILAGNNGGIGVGLVEIYDINQQADSQLANISTRGFVRTGDNVMIGGFILGGNSNTGVVVRGIGPSLGPSGLSPVLADPTLDLRDSNGALLISNDDWQDNPASAAALTVRGLALQNPQESGIFASLPPGTFTAILAGVDGGTGIGLVEIYNVH